MFLLLALNNDVLFFCGILCGFCDFLLILPQNGYYIIYQVMAESIGTKLRRLRTANHFSQGAVAHYLEISPSMYQAIEAGERVAQLKHLEKLSALFGFELSDLNSDDADVLENMLVCAFRVDGLTCDDLRQVASFKEIVLNDLKLNRILNR